MNSSADSQTQIVGILLAAGRGKRMLHRKPKTLIMLKGKPMVSYATEALLEVGLTEIIAVVGTKAKKVAKVISKIAKATGVKPSFAHQNPPIGTADAVKKALDILDSRGEVNSRGEEDSRGEVNSRGEEDSRGKEDICLLVLPADAPLITTTTLKRLTDQHFKSQNPATVLTAMASNPTGYGRIVRNKSGQLKKIVEHKDATAEELSINEVCTSIYCFSYPGLMAALKEVKPLNASQEYYLTDVVEILIGSGQSVGTYLTPNFDEIAGVNSPEEFKRVSEILTDKQAPNTTLNT